MQSSQLGRQRGASDVSEYGLQAQCPVYPSCMLSLESKVHSDQKAFFPKGENIKSVANQPSIVSCNSWNC